MSEEFGFETQLHGTVLMVVLARPEKMNALRISDVDALRGLFERSATDPAVHCLLVTGQGRAFCAGRDAADAIGGEDAGALLRDSINPMVQALFDLPKPTIAAVNGHAMGVGLGLALACDIVLAGDAARFSSPFARLGSALDTGGHHFLPRRMSIGRVFEMVYTGDAIGGAEAARAGLVDRVVPDAQLMADAAALAERIAAGPQIAFQGQKALLRSLGAAGLDTVLAAEADLQGRLALTPDYAEGIAAFRARRAPVFTSVGE
ncbi:enoyl-CoA hydratase/isomerase family protein [Sphingopyxis sp.]|uniref:enoyl-CoA hydratase/isomerase family protein n=1 Tax=Sphingopyxis sp. TaxID=1908224 RepID=UPI003D6CC7D9